MLPEPKEYHPVQVDCIVRFPNVPAEVALLAYEVYCHVYSPQPAMVDLAGRGCRGGFGAGELIAFLYARNFPKSEWSDRVDFALKHKP